MVVDTNDMAKALLQKGRLKSLVTIIPRRWWLWRGGWWATSTTIWH